LNQINNHTMNNLDQYKTEAPEDRPENNCYYCGEPCDGRFCDKNCMKAELNG
jgi:hypothetical protein